MAVTLAPQAMPPQQIWSLSRGIPTKGAGGAFHVHTSRLGVSHLAVNTTALRDGKVFKSTDSVS